MGTGVTAGDESVRRGVQLDAACPVPKRLITTWITDGTRDRYTEKHRELFARCMASWLRWMPDWQIVVVTLADCVAESMPREVEQWARDGVFIGLSQWARLRWLYLLGGVYVDTDVEAVASFEPLRAYDMSVGHEGGDAFANNAVMAARQRHPFVADMGRDVVRYSTSHAQFGNETGPRMLTRFLRKQTSWDGEDVDQDVAYCPVDGRAEMTPVRVWASDMLYPTFYRRTSKSLGRTDRTIAVHHWGASWVVK